MVGEMGAWTRGSPLEYTSVHNENEWFAHRRCNAQAFPVSVIEGKWSLTLTTYISHHRNGVLTKVQKWRLALTANALGSRLNYYIGTKTILDSVSP